MTRAGKLTANNFDGQILWLNANISFLEIGLLGKRNFHVLILLQQYIALARGTFSIVVILWQNANISFLEIGLFGKRNFATRLDELNDVTQADEYRTV